jgi:hypothetical protein
MATLPGTVDLMLGTPIIPNRPKNVYFARAKKEEGTSLRKTCWHIAIEVP